jgi:plastocyanin
VRALAAVLAAAALVAGCGGNTPPQPAGSIKVVMTEFKYAPSTIEASNGKVVFYLVNSGTTAHNLIIRDSAGRRLKTSELVSAGDASIFTVDSIAAGTYSFFCDQQGHEASGMKGTLTIT